LYAALLTLIAKDRDKQGLKNFEANPVTRFYEEIIQASQGSRRVLCVTLATVSEGYVLVVDSSWMAQPQSIALHCS
jgi:hypothetical protein